MVDRETFDNLDKYFILTRLVAAIVEIQIIPIFVHHRGRDIVGVLEDHYCDQDIKNMKTNMIKYRTEEGTSNNLERDLLKIR